MSLEIMLLAGPRVFWAKEPNNQRKGPSPQNGGLPTTMTLQLCLLSRGLSSYGDHPGPVDLRGEMARTSRQLTLLVSSLYPALTDAMTLVALLQKHRGIKKEGRQHNDKMPCLIGRFARKYNSYCEANWW